MTNKSTEISTPPWTDGLYSIKRHGLTLTNCESEPVQMPGCIQSHGAMLVLRLSDLTILQASENSEQLLGQEPELLLGHNIAKIVGVANAAHLQEVLKTEPIECNSLYVFTLPINESNVALDVCVHTIEGVAVLEFEVASRNGGHADDILAKVRTAVTRIQGSNSVREFCQLITEEVRRITALDRVMVYRFHPDKHGEVFAESKSDDLAPWLGLHYPESDIPKPAREIFKRIWIRPLPNAAELLAELVPLANPDTGRPLNMTYCALRGASVMYTEYLANMGVAASLTMPIMIDGELWGLIACHHYTPTHFPHKIRSACEFLAQVASLQLKSTEQKEQFVYRLRLEGMHQQLVAKAAQEGDMMALLNGQPSLLDAMDAGGVAFYHMNHWECAGNTPDQVQLEALADWLNQRPEFDSETRPVFVTNSLTSEYSAGAEIANIASGLIAIRLSRLRHNIIMWFRPETIQSVNWAGNPNEKLLVPGPHGSRLTPRGSFELFVESVRELAVPWLSVEIDSVLRLRLLVMELVISRAEQLAELNQNLNDSNEELDSFAHVASHDLKEPLRGIHRYAHQLLEGAQELDAENRQRVESLMRLTVRMDSLLDSLLHFSQVGRTNLEFENTDLNEVLEEALEMIGARRTENSCTVDIPRKLPVIRCDPIRVREIFTNLVSNALKYTLMDCPRIEIGYLAPNEPGAPLSTPISAKDQTVFYVHDNGIGIEVRYFEQIFGIFKRLHGRNQFGGGIGAGLAIVKKVVQRHGGCIWLDSKIGVGTTFYFTLPSTDKKTR